MERQSNTPHIGNVSPVAGAPGETITLHGTGFGTAQGSGTVQLGTAAATVSSWSDTQIVAMVAATAQNGIAQVTQNGVPSNAINFSVPLTGTSTTANLTPNLFSMVVGDTRSPQALDANGNVVTGLTWASSNTGVVSLSTDDPPIITALAPGHVTITAGDGSADLTVYAGPTLPLGTIQWSSPGDGSGVTSIVPAVPSSAGVADVFAFQTDGSAQAITSDGKVAWTANVGTNSLKLSDFQGGMVIANPGSVQKLDGMTGQPNPAYTLANPNPFGNATTAVHTDGTIFTIDGDSVVGIDPTTGTSKFSVRMEDSVGETLPFCEFQQDNRGAGPPTVYQLIIAGDGYAYVAYSYENSLRDPQVIGSCNNSFAHFDAHLRVLRVGTDGSNTEIPVGDWKEDWSATANSSVQQGNIPGLEASMITNADQGVLLSWSASFSAYCAGGTSGCVDATAQYRLTAITGGSVTSDVTLNIPGQQQAIEPTLQRQDGSFIGTVGIGPNSGANQFPMIAFDQAGKIKWSVPGNYQPMIATADGGVIAKSLDTGAAATFDANGKATGQMASLPTQTWLGNEYEVGSIDKLAAVMLTRPAPSFWAFFGANASGSGTAAVLYDPPQTGLQTISSANLTAQSACNTFLDNLTAIAIANGRDPLGPTFTKAALLTEIQATASGAIDYVYDGPSSNTAWDQCTTPNCVAKFPVWFTGEQKPDGYLVKQEFEDNGPGTFHYLEGLSQYNGYAIWLRELDDWSGTWKGLTSQYITTLSLSKAGQVNNYGLGTLFHEVLHKKSVGGGFTHADMSQALGIGSCSGGGAHNACSDAIASICFPN